MKKLILLIIAIMTITLAGCGQTQQPQESEPQESMQQTVIPSVVETDNPIDDEEVIETPEMEIATEPTTEELTTLLHFTDEELGFNQDNGINIYEGWAEITNVVVWDSSNTIIESPAMIKYHFDDENEFDLAMNAQTFSVIGFIEFDEDSGFYNVSHCKFSGYSDDGQSQEGTDPNFVDPTMTVIDLNGYDLTDFNTCRELAYRYAGCYVYIKDITISYIGEEYTKYAAGRECALYGLSFANTDEFLSIEMGDTISVIGVMKYPEKTMMLKDCVLYQQ